jgi:ABC-type sulfate transport system permease subunit
MSLPVLAGLVVILVFGVAGVLGYLIDRTG